ncbi:glutamine amidotransferase [Microbacterium sp. NPDC089189]|uniref:glutamine amidotransferase n=1 Tax=Microbacterium sp. NPDC089189 TaxID=3154972 RepID=UPI003437529E
MTTLHIVQLYPDLLGVTGDRGNVEVLAARAGLSGITAEIARITVGEASPEDADIIVIGNGPLSALRVVREDLVGRGDWLRERVAAGAVVLAVGGGAELLTDGVDPLEGPAVEGLGIIGGRVARTRQRRVGYVVADTVDGKLIGFEDHASVWRLKDPSAAYGRVIAGDGGVEGGFETVVVGSVYATNIQGPVLPLNPALADVLLTRALARHGVAYRTGDAHAEIDRHAAAARAEIERLAVSKRFTAIQL